MIIVSQKILNCLLCVLTDARACVGDDKLYMTAIIECVFNFGLPVLDILVEAAEILLDEFADPLAIG